MIAQNHYFHAETESNVLWSNDGSEVVGASPWVRRWRETRMMRLGRIRPSSWSIQTRPRARSSRSLLQGYRMTVEVYSSGREFFAAFSGDDPGCLVLEQRICDISGLQIQRRLAERNQRLPMIYVVAAGLDVPTAVALMRGGAIHVLEKPLRQNTLVLHDAIQEALNIDQKRRAARSRESVG